MILNYKYKILIPIFLIALYTPWAADFDLYLSHLFFHNGHFVHNPFVEAIFKYGFYPAWILVGIMSGLLIFSFLIPQKKNVRKAALYLLLTLAIGAGLMVHVILKDHWGRPRPRQVIEFGGNQPFRAYYQPHFSLKKEAAKSFPCGHCSTGFYFFSLALLGYYYKRKDLYWIGMGLAFGLGILLGYARIAQGGHFFSDVVFAALIMWLVSLFLFHLIFERGNNSISKK